jgi:phosphatidylglycerophosphate synthase
VEGPVLAASANILVQVRDVSRCLVEGKGLRSNAGEALPLGVTSASGGEVNPPSDPLAQLSPEGVAWLVEDAGSARAAEAALWASMGSGSDGWVDQVFNRPCGRPLSRWLVHTAVSPNAVSVLSILLGVAAAAFFAHGLHASALVGGLLFQLSAVIDCVDGDLARVLFKESKLGKWLDLAGDQVVHILVFAGVAIGVFQTGEQSRDVALWLGTSAVAGALLSFGVVVRGLRRRAGMNSRLKQLIDSATNRDFSVLVLILACVQELDLFLWLAAVGSHLFWVAALSLQIFPGSRVRA